MKAEKGYSEYEDVEEKLSQHYEDCGIERDEKVEEVDLFFQRTKRSLSEDDALHTLGTAKKRAALIERVRTDLYTTQRQRQDVEMTNLEIEDMGGLGPGPDSPRGNFTTGKSDDENSGTKTIKLGTFKGVFIPCLQNILGVILFLRLTWITAQAGTYLTSGIVLVSAGSTFLTALSLSAVATNGRVAKGGPYFIISRNLGPEVGTAIGLMFYLGTTVAASLYVLGAVESLYDGFQGFFNQYKWEMRNPSSALGLMLLLACIVRVGVKQVNKAAELFLAVVLFSVASSILGCILFAADVATGDLEDSDRAKATFASGPRYKKDPNTGIVPDAQVLLSIFYPSVTGIMAGSNRSGVLATPSQSIPIGTLSAIFVTTILYLVVVWLFGLSINRSIMFDEQLVVALVAWPSVPLVKAGIVCSTIGAALQSLTGAPRLLYAIASDGTLPFLSRALIKNSIETEYTQTEKNNMYSPPPTTRKMNHTPNFSESERKSSESALGTRLRTSMLHRVESSQRLVHNVAHKLIRLTGPSITEKKDNFLQQVESSPKARQAHRDIEEQAVNTTTTTPQKNKKKPEVDVTPLAVGVTWFIASLPCLAGNLTRITPIVTMLFLVMYATVNLACFFLAYMRSPGFRPTWKYFHWSSALLGFLWCLGLMFAISWYLALIALVIAGSVAAYVRKEGVNKDWGDSVAGIRFQVARDQLIALSERSTFHHAKNWRPQLLVMLKLDYKFNPERPELLEIAASLKKGQGLLMAHALIDAEAYGSAPRSLVADAATEVLRLHLIDHHIQGFPRAVVYRHRGSRAGTHLAGGHSDLLVDPPLMQLPSSPFATPDAFAPYTSSGASSGIQDEANQDEAATAETHENGNRRRLPPPPIRLPERDDENNPKSGEIPVQKRKAIIVDNRRALMDAILAAAQSCGVGALRPNALLLGWPAARGTSSTGPQSPSSHRARRTDFVQLLRDISSMRKAIIVVKGGKALMQSPENGAESQASSTTIDIWWVVQDGGLLLLLPWLMCRAKTFAPCRLRVYAVMTGLFANYWNARYGGAKRVSECTDIESESKLLTRFTNFVKKLLADLRIDAEIHGVAGIDYVWAAAHAYRDTIGLRKQTTYEQQISTRRTKREFFADRIGRLVSSPRNSASSSIDSNRDNNKDNNNEEADSVKKPQPRALPEIARPEPRQEEDSIIDDDQRLRPLRGFALALNGKMREHSANARLIVTNLPYMTHLPSHFFLEFVDSMTHGLPSVMLVRGSGTEVVTKYG